MPYFLAESEAKQSDPRKEAAGARARNAVEDLNVQVIRSYSWAAAESPKKLARNGYEGLKAVKDSSPDLMLSDIKMPGMDEIRALGSDAANSVPVIAMSAHFSRTDGDRINRAHFRACLPKPFTPDKLVETILGVL